MGQWLTVASIAVGLTGIYYKREELKAAFKNSTPSAVKRQNVEQGALPPSTPLGDSPIRKMRPHQETPLRAGVVAQWNEGCPLSPSRRGQAPSPTSRRRPQTADRRQDSRKKILHLNFANFYITPWRVTAKLSKSFSTRLH